MIRNRKQNQQSICKQPLEWWIYATPFNSYTRKFDFGRESASPAADLTARRCYIRPYSLNTTTAFYFATESSYVTMLVWGRAQATTHRYLTELAQSWTLILYMPFSTLNVVLYQVLRVSEQLCWESVCNSVVLARPNAVTIRSVPVINYQSALCRQCVLVHYGLRVWFKH